MWLLISICLGTKLLDELWRWLPIADSLGCLITFLRWSYYMAVGRVAGWRVMTDLSIFLWTESQLLRQRDDMLLDKIKDARLMRLN
jgi:hypothetical protein